MTKHVCAICGREFRNGSEYTYTRIHNTVRVPICREARNCAWRAANERRERERRDVELARIAYAARMSRASS